VRFMRQEWANISKVIFGIDRTELRIDIDS